MSDITPYRDLIAKIGELLHKGREQAGRAVNTALVQTYENIRQHIVEYEQGTGEQSASDSELMDRLSEDLAPVYGSAINPNNIIEKPNIFEFLGIPQQQQYLEGELEEKLIHNLEQFLLELGKGFAFIGRQYRISLANRHFYVDLVFYHRILKCFVLIDLKRGEIEHTDIGQMNMYLNYFAKEENVEGDNPPIGIVLGAYKDHILVEYATENISNQLFVSKYQLYLPDKAVLSAQLEKLLADDGNTELL